MLNGAGILNHILGHKTNGLWLKKYFTISESGAAVHENLKDVVIVSNHNVCQDPPFINVDLVCCRNLLIYFGAALQARVLSRLNYALREDGMILLGTAESVSVSEEPFPSRSYPIGI